MWQRYKEWLYYHPELNFYVDISRIGFTTEFVDAMEVRFEKAFAEMKALEAGAIANPDERRMVGHYWLRAPELAPNDVIRHDIETTLQRVLSFAQDVHNGLISPPSPDRTHFTDVICIGIGGSALGPQFVSHALAPLFPPLKLHFIDNTDPDGIDRLLTQLGEKLQTTLTIVTSKSGGTPETANAMKEVSYAYAQMGLEFPAHAVAITSEASKLDLQARQESWLDTFPMYDWIGGRTSEMSAVGLLPAALEGIDVFGILTGAKLMDSATRVPNLRHNPAALLSLAWYWETQGRGEKDMVILPYKDRLLLFSRYLQQLVMESLGKAKDRDGKLVEQGIAVYGNKGTTDQHAYVQQLRDGVNNFFVTFFEVLNDRPPREIDNPQIEVEPGVYSGDYLSGALLGTRKALFENKRDSITITIGDVTPSSVGALIALYERAVGFYASLVNINAYDQPGVEAGKKAANYVLQLQTRILDLLNQENRPMGLEELSQKTAGDIETIYQIVRHLDANFRINLEGNTGKPDTLLISPIQES